MKSLIDYKIFKCNNCGDEYQGVHAYQHVVLGVVCYSCMDAEVYDSKWA